MVNREDLEYSIEYFDKLVIELITNPPEDFNTKSFARHYNVIKNFLAENMKSND